ncbi:tol-pal system YbgF family protein [Kitasatospora sp. NPDC058046]|uniref:tetratricopeptide repeat protein n=1 Tax=Kitasatospora sp. NPDC058046 TaxID=3346312 RepID=UPI0036DA016A
MAEEPGDHPLARARAVRKLERSDLARELRENSTKFGTPLGTGRDGVLRWESGRTPDDPTQLVMAHLFGIDSNLIGSYPWPRWLEFDPLQQPDDYPWTGPGALGALRDAIGSGMKRRTFFIGSSMLTTTLLSWLTADPLEAAQFTSGRRLSEGAVTSIERCVRELRLTDDEDGGGTLIRDTTATLAAVVDLLSNRSHSLAHESRLYAAGADLVRIRAWAVFDVAGRCDDLTFKAALQAAHAAGDSALGAHILTFWSAAAYNCGRAADAEAMASAALAAVRGKAAPRVEALVLARRARARSHLEDSGCWSDLEAARDLLEAAERNPDDEPDWAYWFDASEYEGCLASTQLAMGHADQAEETFARQARAFSGTAVRTQAIYLVRMADAQLQQNHLEQACATANQAVDLTAGISSHRAVEPLKALGASMATHNSAPEVRELRERIAALV